MEDVSIIINSRSISLTLAKWRARKMARKRRRK